MSYRRVVQKSRNSFHPPALLVTLLTNTILSEQPTPMILLRFRRNILVQKRNESVIFSPIKPDNIYGRKNFVPFSERQNNTNIMGIILYLTLTLDIKSP